VKDKGEIFEWGELPVKPGELDPTKKPVLSTPCLLRGDIFKKKIIDFTCGALHSLFLDGTEEGGGEGKEGKEGRRAEGGGRREEWRRAVHPVPPPQRYFRKK
jgi:hypothetical protein